MRIIGGEKLFRLNALFYCSLTPTGLYPVRATKKPIGVFIKPAAGNPYFYSAASMRPRPTQMAPKPTRVVARPITNPRYGIDASGT